MKTVTLDVRAPEDALQDFAKTWKTGKFQKAARMLEAT